MVSVDGDKVNNRNNPMSPNRGGNFGGWMNSSNFSSNLAEVGSNLHDHNWYQNGSDMNGHNNINVNGNDNGNGMSRQKFASLSTGGTIWFKWCCNR